MQTHTANLPRANANRTCGTDKYIPRKYLRLPATILALLTTASIRPRKSAPAATARNTGSFSFWHRALGICRFPYACAPFTPPRRYAIAVALIWSAGSSHRFQTSRSDEVNGNGKSKRNSIAPRHVKAARAPRTPNYSRHFGHAMNREIINRMQSQFDALLERTKPKAKTFALYFLRDCQLQ